MIWDSYFEWQEPWHDNPDLFSRWQVKLKSRASIGARGYLFEADKPGLRLGNFTDEEDLLIVIKLIQHYVRNIDHTTEMPTREILGLV